MIDSDRMTTSAASPFLTRSRSEPAVLKVRSTLLPLARSNSRPSSSTIDCTAPALKTLMVGTAWRSHYALMRSIAAPQRASLSSTRSKPRSR